VTALADAATGAIQGLGYAYDAADNVLSIAGAVTPSNGQAFGYDVLNRLTSAGGAYGSLAYTYDKVGNRLKQTLDAAVTNYGYTSGTNHLASTTAGGATTPVSYTATGNISNIPPATGSPVATLTYNAANRLASVTGVTVAISSMVYDAFGQRFSKANPGSNPTIFTYGQDGSLLEEMNNGAATDYIYLNGRPVATISPSTGKVYFLHDDRLGTPQVATDASQNVVWSASYQPFGSTGASATGTITQNLRLPGQYADGETGWNNNGFRDYMPGLGAYAESDPSGIFGGANTFGYAGANPIKNSDRWGLADYYGRTYSPLDPNYHSYTHTDITCLAIDPGCSVQNVYNQLLTNAAPGQTEPATNGDTMMAVIDGWIPGGMITQTVDPSNLSVTNTTVPCEHLFNPGYVTRSVVLNSAGTISIQTFGEGTGPLGTFNQLIGPSLFQGLDANIRNRIVGPPTD